jgi:hypothetical protein
MMFHILLILTALVRIDAHSWADNVGGGSYRGAQGGNDLVKQRYFCPKSSLDQCQPPANTNIVLDASAMRPCRTDFPTPTWGQGSAGQPMYVHWAGNGHTGDKGAGTCVSISIAPFASDPDMSAFRSLAGCLPFSHDGDVTDAYVTLPSDLSSGQYTVLWVWDFGGFWFSSCSDINVGGGPASTAAPVSTSLRPDTTTAQTHSATTNAPSTVSPVQSSSAPGPVSTKDCKGWDRPNAECQTRYGSGSYCVSWEMDKCGRSHCLGATISDSAC